MKVYLNENKIKENIVIITGASRSGKTTISKILASCENVGWIEEPFDISNFIIMYGMGQISDDIFTMLFNSSVHELINDNVLLRNANFRPNDLSSIWNVKSASEILYRLHDVNSRDDVINYITTNQCIFLIDMPEITRFIPLIRKNFNNLTVINVIRNGYDVADACFKKGWFTEKDQHSTHRTIYRDYYGKKIIWWLNTGNENHFLKANDYERGLNYWTDINKCLLGSDFIDYTIRYEDLCSNPQQTMNNLIKSLNLRSTSITKKLLSEIVPGYDVELPFRSDENTNFDKKTFAAIMERYGYECSK